MNVIVSVVSHAQESCKVYVRYVLTCAHKNSHWD